MAARLALPLGHEALKTENVELQILDLVNQHEGSAEPCSDMGADAAGQGRGSVDQRLPVSADAIGSDRTSSAGISMCFEGKDEADRHEGVPGL